MYLFVCTLLIMIFVHVIVDFRLQGILAEFKCKSYWADKYTEDELNTKYHNDYKISLLCHAMSWSAAVTLPVMWFTATDIYMYNMPGIPGVMFIAFAINTAIHYYVDDLKANKHKIGLFVDQIIHFAQIILLSLTPFIYYLMKYGIVMFDMYR